MIQELLAKYRNNAEAEWAKGNIMATPETVGPSGTGQEAKISLTQIPKGHSFLLQRSCWNSKLKSFAHKSFTWAQPSQTFMSVHERAVLPYTDKPKCESTAPSRTSPRQIPSLTRRSKEPCATVQAGDWQAKQHLRQEKGSGEQEAECVSAAGADCSAPSKSTARSFMGQTIPF